MSTVNRVIAVDWSGALQGSERHIWLAEVRAEGLVRLECGRSREELCEHLIQTAQEEPRLLVGLDFAFSFPAWFLQQLGVHSARELWARVERDGEAWMAACQPPFWGRRGRPRPNLDPSQGAWRHAETEALPIRGIRPKSVFQIGGAGSVGTGSLRGMPQLLKLARAGYSVWPFDPHSLPVVVEIYPRALTGPVHKSRAHQRALYLANHWPQLPATWRDAAHSSEDAFDAAISALALYAARAQFPPPPSAAPEWEHLEGRIFRPLLEPFR